MSNALPHQQPPVLKSADEVDKMTPTERWAYMRQFDQRKQPEWKDPRG